MSDEQDRLAKRIAKLSEMLNNASAEAELQVDNERDACVRKLQFLVETAQENRDTETTPESMGTDNYIRGLQHGIDCLEARKHAGVRAIDEMALGSKIGEFLEAQVKRAVEQNNAEWEAKLKKPPSERPDDDSDFHPGWHGTCFIAEANMATGDQLTNDAARMDALADTGYYDNTCGSNDVLRTMAAWLRKMDVRGT